MNEKNIPDESLELVAGAGGGEEGFKIEVHYTISGTKDPTSKQYIETTYYVEPDETIEHIETRTWQHSLADGANCETFYKGMLCAKGMTMRALNIKPYEVLDMNVVAWGGGW